MLDAALPIALAIISLSVLGAIYRVLRGPSMPDRVIALDMIGIQLLSIVAIVSVMLRSESYSDIILLIGIVAFLGTVAFSKYIERGVAIEYERDGGDDR
ncbi:Na(+)/H(+) antiporter subunit F1 [Paenibacillus antri]|uniref:Na(+)/H(+) antiporter subunit F1 n=1 Tax=Paenibacillus antri TaxID=2582848 RepID=A0A5R9GKL9_9BACL|nr:Na(+)/H(+) antiporter subunit F1 [Paenibacillus antri]TLS53553.1 Na(+)/H(+) antiporter subunit F1 [Paenibacillus antri]